MHRRNFLVVLTATITSILMQPLNALAAAWNKAAFETSILKEVTKSLDIHDEIVSQDIQIIAPDSAENGAIVQVEINSNIANTESISILAEKNPTPLIAHFKFTNGAVPFVVTRIKMAETSDIKIIIKSGNQYYTNSKSVVVLENGCG